jgi:hypothetical protein
MKRGRSKSDAGKRATPSRLNSTGCIRVALGAARNAFGNMVVRQGMSVALLGVVIGLD